MLVKNDTASGVGEHPNQIPAEQSWQTERSNYHHRAHHHHHESQEEHCEYLASLETPTLAQIERIANVQEQKEHDVEKRRSDEASRRNDSREGLTKEKSEEEEAAGAIQRMYRGHRARRELDGLSLSPSTRWVEAIKDTQYRQLTTPHARKDDETNEAQSGGLGSSGANKRWHRISQIMRHAHGEPPESESSSSDDLGDAINRPIHAYHKRQERKEREASKGKMMDLPYFLEMVDLKHRYGSNLRAYHAAWKKADTHENYFYWLDYGEGRNVELSGCSRERLEREQVRYLSREERMQYLVDVDGKGKLRWRKSGELIDTSEEYRDSVEGIVHQGDPAKIYRQDELEALDHEHDKNHPPERRSSDASSTSSSNMSEQEMRYPDPDPVKEAKGPKKMVQVTPAVILNRLLRKSIKKNTWIFAVDTSLNLYVGIKQSGSFQHSSFIQGTRISAAGLIKVKRGQLRSLSPLSGHYRPPTSAFKHFVEYLKDQQVDMSRVSISKSFALLVGLEAYMGSKQRIKHAEQKLLHGVQQVISPTKAHMRKELEKDSSQSARLEEQKIKELREQEGVGRVLKRAREKIRVDERPSTRGSEAERTETKPINRESAPVDAQNATSDKEKADQTADAQVAGGVNHVEGSEALTQRPKGIP